MRLFLAISWLSIMSVSCSCQSLFICMAPSEDQTVTLCVWLEIQTNRDKSREDSKEKWEQKQDVWGWLLSKTEEFRYEAGAEYKRVTFWFVAAVFIFLVYLKCSKHYLGWWFSVLLCVRVQFTPLAVVRYSHWGLIPRGAKPGLKYTELGFLCQQVEAAAPRSWSVLKAVSVHSQALGRWKANRF